MAAKSFDSAQAMSDHQSERELQEALRVQGMTPTARWPATDRHGQTLACNRRGGKGLPTLLETLAALGQAQRIVGGDTGPLLQLSVAERIELVQDLWDSVWDIGSPGIVFGAAPAERDAHPGFQQREKSLSNGGCWMQAAN